MTSQRYPSSNYFYVRAPAGYVFSSFIVKIQPLLLFHIQHHYSTEEGSYRLPTSCASPSNTTPRWYSISMSSCWSIHALTKAWGCWRCPHGTEKLAWPTAIIQFSSGRCSGDYPTKDVEGSNHRILELGSWARTRSLSFVILFRQHGILPSFRLYGRLVRHSKLEPTEWRR